MPDHCVMHPRKASIAIRFVVVGGSIAGLATAYALRTAGHDVVLLEQSDGKSRVSPRSECGGLLAILISHRKSHGGIRLVPTFG